MSQNQAKVLIAAIVILIILSVVIFFGRKSNKDGLNSISSNNQVIRDQDSIKSGEYIPFFQCPVSNCFSAKLIYDHNGEVNGVGFNNLKKGEDIIAVIEGRLTSKEENGNLVVKLVDRDGLEVTYNYSGTVKSEGNFGKGDIIGSLGDKYFSIPDNKGRFQVRLTVKDTRINSIIKLGPDKIPNSLKIL